MQGVLERRKALVTGGNRGIGAAILESFAGSGAEVAFCHLGDADRASALVGRLEGEGSRVSQTKCDVSDEVAVGRMLSWARPGSAAWTSS